MFGVASNFRKTHGEAAFDMLARSTFAEADTDKSGLLDMSELQRTLMKVGMKLTDAQTAQIVETYDVDGNHELDVDEFMKLISELIDGSATKKLPKAAQKEHAKVEARGIVMNASDLFGSDDEDDAPKKKKAAPKKAAAIKPPAAAGAGKAPAAMPAAQAEKLKTENSALKAQNDELSARVKQLEAQVAAARGGGGGKR